MKPKMMSLSTMESTASKRNRWPCKGRIGGAVWTNFGTALLIDVRQTDGFHVVQFPSGYIGYLHIDAVSHELKAMRGDRVKTDYGYGTIDGFYPKENKYDVALDWRWDDEHIWRMKANAEKFERVSSRSTILQKTTTLFSGGYSTLKAGTTSLRASTTGGYATVKAKLAAGIPGRRNMDSDFEHRDSSEIYVTTPFGPGLLLKIRDEDKIHVVRLCGNGYAYLQSRDVTLGSGSRNSSECRVYASGDRVHTAYGTGIIVECTKRPDGLVYRIELDWGLGTSTLYMPAKGSQLSHLKTGKSSSLFGRTGNYLSKTIRATTSSGYETMKAFSARKVSFVIMQHTRKTPVFKTDERILTPFGSGYVVEVRPDNIHVVRLRRAKALGYFDVCQLSQFPYHLIPRQQGVVPQ